MAELNLKQIIDRLNAEFTGDTRKLVFWYDDKADFAEDLENVELENAKIYRLQPDNQFYTKYFLERVDTTTNYLVYAPFPKPDVRENHLEDTLLYSRRFFADRASLLSVDLGIEEKYKPILEKHIKFIGLIAEQEGIKALHEAHQEVDIYLDAQEETLQTDKQFSFRPLNFLSSFPGRSLKTK